MLLRQVEEGARALDEYRHRCVSKGFLYGLLFTDTAVGVCRVLQGEIGAGIHFIEQYISNFKKDGLQRNLVSADISELYLQIIGGNEKLPFGVLLKNLPILIKVTVTASSRIRTLMADILDNPHFDPAGFHVGRARMILGLLYKIKKKRALALEHLTEAQRILSQFGQTPILARVETALAELGQ